MRGDAEHHLNVFQRLARAVAIRADTIDRHEMLMLLPLPPKTLCSSTGHYPQLPWEPVQHTTARVPRSRDNFPGRTHGVPQAVAKSC